MIRKREYFCVRSSPILYWCRKFHFDGLQLRLTQRQSVECINTCSFFHCPSHARRRCFRRISTACYEIPPAEPIDAVPLTSAFSQRVDSYEWDRKVEHSAFLHCTMDSQHLRLPVEQIRRNPPPFPSTFASVRSFYASLVYFGYLAALFSIRLSKQMPPAIYEVIKLR